MTTKPTTWSMEEQLKVGRKGERLLLKHWPEPVRQREEDLKGPDFVDIKGRLIELKTDTWKVEETPNFFMERWSSVEGMRPGGPWQAVGKGSTVLVYLFINSGVWYVFEDLPALCQKLDDMVGKMSYIQIRNRGWTTRGYRIPRESLVGLYTEVVLPAPPKRKRASTKG